jgi:hypothetical protein
MPKYIVVPTTIKKEDVIDWSQFDRHIIKTPRTEIQPLVDGSGNPILDENGNQEIEEITIYDEKDYSNLTKSLQNMEASDEILNFNLRRVGWLPYKRKVDGNFVIGYDSKKDLDGDGYTELQAWNDWISKWKTKEKQFQKLFPISELTQSQYDAMLSLYYNTGEFNYIGSEVVKFDLRSYLENGDWDYIATAFVQNGNDRIRTQAEAKIMMLGFYGKYISRSKLIQNGLEVLRKNYPKRIKDSVSKQQAEYIYYVETGNFLPGLSQSRMRQIVEKSKRK